MAKLKIAFLFLASVTVLISLPGGAAWAQEEPEALIRQGVELRRQGKDALAQGYFKRAYGIAHTPRSAAQLGLVEQALGYFLDAEQHLSEALANADAWVDQNRALLERSRTFVRGKLLRVKAHGLPAGTTLRVAGRPTIPVGPDGVLWVSPGSSKLAFEAPDHAPLEKAVDGEAGETVVLDIELVADKAAPRSSAPAVVAPPVAASAIGSGEPAASPQQPAPADISAASGGGRGHRVAGVVVGSAGVALIAGGLATYLIGSSKLDAINHDAAAHAPYNPANSDYQTLGNVGIGLLAAGGAALVSGAALYVFSASAPATEGHALSFGYLPGGGLQIAGRF